MSGCGRSDRLRGSRTITDDNKRGLGKELLKEPSSAAASSTFEVKGRVGESHHADTVQRYASSWCRELRPPG